MTDKDLVENTKAEFDRILNQNGLKIGYEIGFPIYRIIPDEVKLSLEVLKKHGMTISVVLKQKNNRE